jgi:hypothetical protein
MRHNHIHKGAPAQLDLASVMATLEAMLDGVLSDALREWAAGAVAAGTYSDAALLEHVLTHAALDVSGAWARKDSVGVVTLPAELVEALGMAPTIEVEPLLATRLLLEGAEACRAFLHEAAEVFELKVDRAVAPWRAQAPAWFVEVDLRRWGARKISQDPSCRATPLEDHLLHLRSDALVQLELRASKGSKIQVHHDVECRVGNQLCAVPVKVSWNDLVRLTWAQRDAVSLEAALAQAKAQVTQAPQVQLQRRIDAFATEHVPSLHPTSAWLRALEFSPGQWVELVRTLLLDVGLSEETRKAFARRLDAAVQARRRELALRNCTRALPDRLADLYPLARSLGRQLVLVVGPTNSGKTYRAVERMKSAASSLYLGPLRLLALEIRDRLEADGFPTSLVTGELVEEVEGAKAVASTIEMLDFERSVEVAVIDEVQMLADPQRGSAWVQAVLGAPAPEVWMLGAPEAVEAVKALAQYLGEPLRIVHTERLSELAVDTHTTALAAVPPQSAIVAFSRREVLALAAELKEKHGRNASVIYGALSPEVRRDQADKFRNGEHDVVVATDAISMGLNLPVHHIYFSTHLKWDGTDEQPLADDLTWQIAGRAGRFGHHDKGHVGAFDAQTLGFVQATLQHRPTAVPEVFRHGPTWPLVSAVSGALGLRNLADVLHVFLQELRLGADKRFLAAIGEDQMDVAVLVDRFEVSLRDKLTLSAAPIPLVKGEIPDTFTHFVKCVETGQHMVFDQLREFHASEAAHTQDGAEQAVKMLTLYCWMHYRFQETFPDFELAKQHIDALNAAINRHLAKNRSRRCRECDRPLAVKHRFAVCDACFSGRRRTSWQASRFGFGYAA